MGKSTSSMAVFNSYIKITRRYTGWWFQPLWKIWIRQLGLWHSQYMESQNPVMFQTTNQITIIFPLLLVYSLWKPLFSPSLWTDGKESSNSTVRGFGASTWKNGCNTWLQALFVTWEFMGHFLCPHGSHHPTMNGIWSIINGYFFRWCPLYSQNGTLTNPWNWRWLKKKKHRIPAGWWFEPTPLKKISHLVGKLHWLLLGSIHCV